MLPDRVSNPGPLTYESGTLPIALSGPAPFLYEPELREPSPIYETYVVRDFVLWFSFSIFSDPWSLKIENDNNSIKH